MTRGGRRPGGGDTRGEILDAARTAFGALGYDAATIRVVAARASVDPALVHHYFGTKEQLFAAAMEVPVELLAVMDAVIAEGVDDLGERLLATMLAMWDDAPSRSPMIGLVRAAVANESAAQMVREFITAEIFGRLVRAIDAPDPDLRAALVGSQVVGLVMVRYVVGVEPIASADPETIVAALAPTIQRYLTGDIA